MMLKQNRYKEKTCPICGSKHKKKRQCCSLKCGFIFRSQTPTSEEAKKNISDGIKKWKQTPKGESTNSNLNTVLDEDDMLLPPIESNKDYYLEDGDIWSPVNYK